MRPTRLIPLLTVAGGLLVGGCDRVIEAIDDGVAWPRHVVDDRLLGADGVRLGDVNRDGREDLVVGWETSGVVAVYLHPGPSDVANPWPRVVVGRVGEVEDAAFVDLDGDGVLDVVSCSEGGTQAVHVHWAPADATRLLDGDAWRTDRFPALDGRRWMFAVPADINADGRVDLVVGGKGDDGAIGWLAAPLNPRDTAGWTWRPIRSAAWVMSIFVRDVDGDEDLDVLFSDRKGDGRGFYVCRQEGGGVGWLSQRVLSTAGEAMFADLRDGFDGVDVAVATDRREIVVGRLDRAGRLRQALPPLRWSEDFGTGKAVAWGDLDDDGTLELVFSCERADGRRGLGAFIDGAPAPIADRVGAKFDLIQLVDVDADGDLDVLTTEEAAGLGAVWYENPR